MNRWPVKKRADLVPTQAVEGVSFHEHVTTVKVALMLVVEAMKQWVSDGDSASVQINTDGICIVRKGGTNRPGEHLTIDEFAKRVVT
jgi:hypothetical protein